jgi:hypothetical protein
MSKEDIGRLLRLAKGSDLSKGIAGAVLDEAKKIVLSVK